MKDHWAPQINLLNRTYVTWVCLKWWCSMIFPDFTPSCHFNKGDDVKPWDCWGPLTCGTKPQGISMACEFLALDLSQQMVWQLDRMFHGWKRWKSRWSLYIYIFVIIFTFYTYVTRWFYTHISYIYMNTYSLLCLWLHGLNQQISFWFWEKWQLWLLKVGQYHQPPTIDFRFYGILRPCKSTSTCLGRPDHLKMRDM